MAPSIHVAEKVLRVRLAQLIINEHYKKGEFKIPIHLAVGHEAIAVAVSEVMCSADRLVLPHRNIHYNLARSRAFRRILDEFQLRTSGLAGARLGSMNLSNGQAGISYASSILGNAMGVGAGVGLGLRVQATSGVVVIVTGDGALEEGAFTESLTFMRTYDISGIVIVENNGWSMSTSIRERRCDIRLAHVASAYDIDYHYLSGNDTDAYIAALAQVRTEVAERRRPAIVEVQIHTLGDRRVQSDVHSEWRYINYHAGPMSEVALVAWPPILHHRDDPVFALLDHFEEGTLRRISEEQLDQLQVEAR